MLREAHAFLHEHGCINTGAALAGEPPASGGGKEEAAPVQLSARFARWTIIHVTAKTKPEKCIGMPAETCLRVPPSI